MKMYLLVFAICIVLAAADLKSDMDALEKELAKAHGEEEKKSLKDLSTDDLIEELKKEIGNTQNSIHDTFRGQFDTILDKKTAVVNEDDFWDKTKRKMLDDMAHLKSKREFEIEKCEDSIGHCKDYEHLCKESVYKELLIKDCKKTCNFCIVDKECSDRIPQDHCDLFVTKGNCMMDGVSDYCAKSCGFCSVSAPPKCSKTSYGCCWDKQTISSDAAGSNCPICEDYYKYVCKTFATDCHKFNIAGRFMRDYCAKICELCSKDCKDDENRAFYCKYWDENLKWCENEPEKMQHYCPKTCGFC